MLGGRSKATRSTLVVDGFAFLFTVKALQVCIRNLFEGGRGKDPTVLTSTRMTLPSPTVCMGVHIKKQLTVWVI
jgi:hypothetical protein